jgi:hypothetical protein
MDSGETDGESIIRSGLAEFAITASDFLEGACHRNQLELSFLGA